MNSVEIYSNRKQSRLQSIWIVSWHTRWNDSCSSGSCGSCHSGNADRNGGGRSGWCRLHCRLSTYFVIVSFRLSNRSIFSLSLRWWLLLPTSEIYFYSVSSVHLWPKAFRFTPTRHITSSTGMNYQSNCNRTQHWSSPTRNSHAVSAHSVSSIWIWHYSLG